MLRRYAQSLETRNLRYAAHWAQSTPAERGEHILRQRRPFATQRLSSTAGQRGSGTRRWRTMGGIQFGARRRLISLKAAPSAQKVAQPATATSVSEERLQRVIKHRLVLFRPGAAATAAATASDCRRLPTTADGVRRGAAASDGVAERGRLNVFMAQMEYFMGLVRYKS